VLFRRRFEFLPPELATPEGIVAVGGPLDVATLQKAYASGIFPWPHENMPLLWFHPDPRAILDFSELHVPERLARTRRKSTLRFTVNTAFDLVIDACQKSPRAGQDGTWITAKMLKTYKELHQLGEAHSVEAWDLENNLVGGLYGVTSGGVFSGESMFHKVSDASKLCVLFLVEQLAISGADWLDIQTMTPHFALLGARGMSREEYLVRFYATQAQALNLFPNV
jgi:leucyl/phenylalanyl-tRNA---protein transferase